MDLSQLIKLKNKNLILQNVDGTNLGIIQARDITLSLRFNALSELTFTIDRENCDVYDLLTSYRKVLLQDVGVFLIENPLNSNDGLTNTKTIVCRSFEIDINRKTIPYLNGTYKFYSIVPTDETIISIIMNYLPNWSIESISSSLWNTYRTFDLTDAPLYQTMMQDIEQAYECVFFFNTLNNTIKIVAYEDILKSSDIYLSFDNLVNKLDITESTESLTTALIVNGVELSVNLVNPLGSSTIYNFDHFLNSIDKTTGIPFMSDSLKAAINGWQTTISSYQIAYADNLTLRKTKISELIVLQSALTDLKTDLSALIGQRDGLLESGQNATAKNTEVKSKQAEVDAKEIAITNKQAEIDAIDVNLATISNTVAFDKYFTAEQLLSIEPYIIQKSVTDEHFVKGGEDSLLDIQNTAQALYDKYTNWLSKNAKLQYEFAIDLINFIEQSDYDLFTSQIDWGITVTLDNGDNTVSYPMLQGLDVSLDNDDVQFLFGTNMRFSSATDTYEEFLANQVSSTVSSVTSSSIKWGEYVNSGNRDKIESLFKKGLQADLTEISNSSNQEVVMNSTGLMGRKLLENGSYDNRQWKMINNKLIFTDDGWDTAKLAIGEITLPDLSKAYGINAEVLMGNLIAGNQLVIKNESNSFVVDSTGATLENAVMSFIGNNGLNRILIDPVYGFKIQKLVNSVWTDVVYLDSEGNAIFEANLAVNSININNKFIVDELGNTTILSGNLNLAETFVVDNLGNVTMNGDLSVGNGKLTFDKTTGILSVEGDISAKDLFLTIDGVKTSIIDEITGKIDANYVSGVATGSAIFKSMIIDQLSTSDKIINYLNSNTAEVNYIFVHDQYIDFYTEDTVNGSEQANSNADGTGLPIYWVEEDLTNNIPAHTYITTEVTSEPVMQYTYATKLRKASYGFDASLNNVPTMVMGAGTGIGDNGKTFIYKGVDGFYIDYRNSITGASTIFKITDAGIDFTQFSNVTFAEGVTVAGISQVWVQDDMPVEAKPKDLWIDTNDYSRYDIVNISSDATLLVSDSEVIRASGTISITLHAATSVGIIKKIKNIGSGIVTLIGTIDGVVNMSLYPKESVMLITNGSMWEIY